MELEVLIGYPGGQSGSLEIRHKNSGQEMISELHSAWGLFLGTVDILKVGLGRGGPMRRSEDETWQTSTVRWLKEEKGLTESVKNYNYEKGQGNAVA